MLWSRPHKLHQKGVMPLLDFFVPLPSRPRPPHRRRDPPSIRIANQYERAVIFRLGRFNRTAGPGLYVVWIFIEWQTKLDLRMFTTAVEQQEGITSDNVPVKVDTVIWYRIVDPERAIIQVRGVANAVEQIAFTTLRTLIGQHSLDDVLKAQDTLSEVMQHSIDAVTEPWGVEIEHVQMKNVEIPPRCSERWRRRPRRCARSAPADQSRGRARRRAQLREGAEEIMQNPAALELRRMQMLTEIGAEQNTMTVVMMPSEFVAMAAGIGKLTPRKAAEPAGRTKAAGY